MLWSDEAKVDIYLENHGYHVLCTEEERDHSAGYSSKTCLSDGVGVH